MKRQGVLIIIALLALGVVSTFALSFQQTELEESWDTIYTVYYGVSDLTLTEPTVTTRYPAGDGLQIVIPASSTLPVSPRIKVEPLDASGEVITIDVFGSIIELTLWTSSDTQIASELIGFYSEFEVDYSAIFSFSEPTDEIAYIRIQFETFESVTGFGVDGLESFVDVYEGLRITVHDNGAA